MGTLLIYTYFSYFRVSLVYHNFIIHKSRLSVSLELPTIQITINVIYSMGYFSQTNNTNKTLI